MILIFGFTLFVFYLVISLRLVTVWLTFSRQDSSSSLEEGLLSRILLGMATILWPVIVPFAYLQLLKAKLEENPSRAYTNSQSFVASSIFSNYVLDSVKVPENATYN